MKKILFALLMLGCAATGAEKVTLDTQIIPGGEEPSSLWVSQKGVSPSYLYKGCNSHLIHDKSIKFYVRIADLYGADKLKSSATYRLDSIAWHGHPEGRHTGEGRRVTISNGSDEMERSMPAASGERVTLRQRKTENPFTFKKSDMLEVTLSVEEGAGGVVCMCYYDGPVAPGVIKGVSFTLTDDGELNEGDATLNKYNRNWRFNCPAIRIRATEITDTRRMVALAGAGVCGLILLLILIRAIRSRKKKK